MKEITLEEQKKILIELLEFIDTISKNNNIKYTLIGGSLIGAIRHKGIIPWDDDIDIGLLPNEYDKLISCLSKNENSRFKLLNLESEPTYYYPFAKLVDTRTTGYEVGCKPINNYGVYVDIFKYNNIPNNSEKNEKYYKKCTKIKNKLFISFINDSNNFIKKIYHKIFSTLDSPKIAKKYNSHCEQYNNDKCENVMINWTPYGAKKETHKKSSFENYITVPFENINAMIIEDYNNVLTTTFGDYMTPPPIEKQITHHSMKMYWKEENEK